MTTPLRLLIVGAHPDDADLLAGGTAALYRRHEHVVHMVSVTNGAAGHHVHYGPELTRRRRAEAAAAAAVIGATYEVLDAPDGALTPSIENRLILIRLIRAFKPDLILTHRPNDYHPDHRYTSQLVQDAAYLVTVPAVASETPHLRVNPVIAYLPDEFHKPTPFEPTVVVDVGQVLEEVTAMLDCHVSQFYEWLPYNGVFMKEMPVDPTERRQFLGEWFRRRIRPHADRWRDLLIRQLGPQRGQACEFAEGFEACEYGSPLDEAAQQRLFGFLHA